MRCRAPRRARSCLLLLALAASTAVLAACTGLPPVATPSGVIVGQGDPTTEDRTTSEFQHLSVGGGLRVVLATGSPLKVTLEAQSNLLPLITTNVVNGQLVVNVKSPGFSSSKPITLSVVAPGLQSVSLSGGAGGTLDATADQLSIDLSGGATLDATGRARTLAVTVSSGAQGRFAGLLADTATVAASGGAQAEVNAVSSLTGSASEGAVVRLTQKPKSLDVKTSGGALVLGG